MASAHPENSFGIFSGKYLFTKLVAAHATNHTQNVVANKKTAIRTMVFEETYGLEDFNGVFEIPIYRLNSVNFEIELDKYVHNQIPFTKDDLENINGKKNAYDNLFEELKTLNGYNWKFNEIAGWITLHLNQEIIFGEIFLKDTKRFRKNSTKKIKFYDCGFKIKFQKEQSNKEIFDDILNEINILALSNLLKNRHVDKLKFETIGPYVDWKNLYRNLNE